jgi:hypothetical protein
MLQRSFVTPFKGTTVGGRRLALYALGLVGFGAGSLANYFSQAADEEQAKLDRVRSDLAEFKVHHLYREEVFKYPW